MNNLYRCDKAHKYHYWILHKDGWMFCGKCGVHK